MIKTGDRPISIMTYMAIMSVCFIINLPGIAVTPMEGKLREILHAPELEIQLLTTLPNFVIIPFVLLTGKLSLCRHKIPWIIASLVIYLACAIGYLFANTMGNLIIVSCLLGCANGILIPFAMGFVVNSFYGKYRTRQLGMKSAISNIAVVISSFIVGILIERNNWHLPFIVYLFAIIPLALSYWLKYVPGLSSKNYVSGHYAQDPNSKNITEEISKDKIWGLIGNNVFFSFIAMSVVIYLPQLIQTNGMAPETGGEIISVFFIFVLLAGYCLLPYVRLLRQFTFFGIALFLTSGLAFICFGGEVWSLFTGAALVGVSFGIFQPFIYDKTSYAVTNPVKNIIALSYVLTALYTAIAVEPFILEGICRIFGIGNINYFVFRLSLGLGGCYALLALFFRNRFAFSVERAYYAS